MSKGKKNLVFYILMLLIFGVLMYLILKMGSHFETTVSPNITQSTKGFFSKGLDIFSEGFDDSLRTPVAMLLLQMIAILFTARVFGWIFVKMGQIGRASCRERV